MWYSGIAIRAPLVSLALALLACGGDPEIAPAPDVESRRPRGLWVLCEGSQRVLAHPERIDTLIEDALRLAATDLFVQVYRGGRAWFDSSFADAGPYTAIRASTIIDPLAQLLAQAHQAGLRVHAWVNVLSLANNREAPIVEALGRESVLMDQHGRSILDYPKLDVPEPDRRYYRMGTPAVWLDPAMPGVSNYLASTFQELLRRYPELDGLHLDYIRYPGVLPFAPGSRFGVGLDFGYGAPTRARFRAETGKQAPLGDSLRNANAWDDWRRQKLTELVRELRTAARAVHPEVELSAAVGSYAERVYLSEGQDWFGWLEEDLIEFAVPMVYTLDDRLFRYIAERFASVPNAARIWIGQGTWLFASRPEGALAQLRVARSLGAAAEVLFSYDSIADAPALRDALAAESDAAP